MAKPLKFYKPALMMWNHNKITDHNRSEMDVSVERIENRNRMADGTLRSYKIADKHTFSVSWDNLPFNSLYTVDGFWGGREMERFYQLENNFSLRLYSGDFSFQDYDVIITDFSKNIVSRGGKYDMWNLSVTMEES